MEDIGRMTKRSGKKADLRKVQPPVAQNGGSEYGHLLSDYASSEKLAPLVREISWSHNVVIMERCKGPLEREFYVPVP